MAIGINTNDDFSYEHLTKQPSSGESEKQAVKALGDKIGYGRLMRLAQQCWREIAIAKGYSGTEFTCGPCAGLTVECGCSSGCDWCGGSQWLTRKVKQLKDKEEEQ